MPFSARYLFVTALLLPTAALSQDVAELQGSWVGRFSTVTGISREATLQIAGDKGSWQVHATDRNNACMGKRTPVVVSDFDGQTFKLAVLGSQALPGCADFSYVVKREGDKAWSTEFGGGRKVSITRQ
jgi:hypothetical protein